jgi:hypothetical protein
MLHDAVQWVLGDVGKRPPVLGLQAARDLAERLREATNTYAHYHYRFAFEPRHRTRIPVDEDQRLQDYFYEYGPPKRFQYELSTNRMHDIDAWKERARIERAERRRYYKPEPRFPRTRKEKT